MREIVRAVLKKLGVKKSWFIPDFYKVPRKGFAKKALLHYKIDSFIHPQLAESYKHTNFWESLEIVRILNRHGYEVDVLDRSNKTFIPAPDEYDLLISNASGNSGSRYVTLASQMQSAYKVFYALGPNPEIANQLVLSRYIRYPDITVPMRVMDQVNIRECMKYTDSIICLDDNGFSSESYEQFEKKLYRISPSASPKCYFSYDFIQNRDRKSFLCFTGDGFIAKGVDYLVQAFLKLPSEYQLYIAGPNSDVEFNKRYEHLIGRAPNIKYCGFLEIGSREHLTLIHKCSYIILPSSAEGLATSVTTSMKYGLVPIVTYQCGVDVKDFGIYLDSDLACLTDQIVSVVQECGGWDADQYNERVLKTVQHAVNYSQASFTYSWEKAIVNIIKDESERK
jgi:glycosyltransferase involved in cell wall biosynthesis